MVRLKLTVAAGLSLALAGCSGQQVEGRWLGAFPLRGSKDCQIELRNTGRFSVACGGTTIVGAGTYAWDGRNLTLRTEVLTYEGHLEPAKPELTFRVEGHGNSMRLTRLGETFDWRRVYR